MIYKQPHSKFYMCKFRFQKKLIRRSTGVVTAKSARIVEAKLRLELANGNWQILEPPEDIPTLRHFIEQSFLSHVQKVFPAESKTRKYYEYGAGLLKKSELAKLPLDKIQSKHARQFDAGHSNLAASTRNCALRTLRRALSYAGGGTRKEDGLGILDRAPRIPLAERENRRERVLTADEAKAYLGACKQPWRDCALIILSTGARPSEVYALRWEQIEWRDGSGIIYMGEGKSLNAKRPLPLLAEVYKVLRARHEAQGYPQEGWSFASDSASGHLEQGSAKNQHQAALASLATAHKGNPKECPEVKPFPPYTLRHTALTWIAPYCDSYTLAKVAGHGSTSMTSRYIHPAQQTIESAFTKMATRQKVVIHAGHTRKSLESGNGSKSGIKSNESDS